jgi:hypothetical protein
MSIWSGPGRNKVSKLQHHASRQIIVQITPSCAGNRHVLSGRQLSSTFQQLVVHPATADVFDFRIYTFPLFGKISHFPFQTISWLSSWTTPAQTSPSGRHYSIAHLFIFIPFRRT